ncbi:MULTISPECIES: hypothetical protein [Methanobacterium]|jgi:uncharacterized repeat protein (TIGR01451 family)|uniref:DUF11 domain-containing protein n=1 Tax=Methanobacterium formicicum TaxID=2162 RepID=A0A843ARP2_METFO|nr:MULTISPECIES: hypothetical protein [Methanobacterium]KUK73263.1 MAG: Uncharacterized protein XD90_1584 [Methanobacterium sp. 42_16]MBF4476241.1 DUF11 domain-containing protein [Methanobacterium formicicum]MDD4810643.1 hypothetical protein [Methanobacterium formicicum]MDI3549048.1 hypothetical protein [Methanobacterium sp.]
MDKNKITVYISTVLLLVFATAGSAFAGADIAVSFDKTTVNVGEQVMMIITITNTGPGDLSNINVSAHIPAGMKFMTSTTGTTKNLYNPTTGIWQVDNLKLSSKEGGKKTLNITMEVLPELAGNTITANATYLSVTDGSNSVPLKSAQSQPLVIGKNTGNTTSNTTSAVATNTPWGTYALVMIVILAIIGGGWYVKKRK